MDGGTANRLAKGSGQASGCRHVSFCLQKVMSFLFSSAEEGSSHLQVVETRKLSV